MVDEREESSLSSFDYAGEGAFNPLCLLM